MAVLLAECHYFVLEWLVHMKSWSYCFAGDPSGVMAGQTVMAKHSWPHAVL